MDDRPLSERWGVWKTATASLASALVIVLVQPALHTWPRGLTVIVGIFLVSALLRAIVQRGMRRRESWKPPNRPS